MNSRFQLMSGDRAAAHSLPRGSGSGMCSALAPCLGPCAATSLPGSSGKAFRAFPKPRAAGGCAGHHQPLSAEPSKVKRRALRVVGTVAKAPQAPSSAAA